MGPSHHWVYMMGGIHSVLNAHSHVKFSKKRLFVSKLYTVFLVQIDLVLRHLLTLLRQMLYMRFKGKYRPWSDFWIEIALRRLFL